MEELRRDAEKLAEERRIAREQAQEWTREVRMDSDDEKEKKVRRPRKPKGEAAAGGSGDEAAGAEPKRRRRKLRKGHAGDAADGEAPADAEDAAMLSEEEDVERPTKKVGSL